MRCFVIFLIRKKLGLKKCERFKFIGQKTDAVYYFTDNNLMKCVNGQVMLSGVSINWLLDSKCEVVRA